MILIERSAPLTYDSTPDDNGRYLGKLSGIGADLLNPTRNGRKYTLKLWRNVENSEEFKEGMETHTIFGELDHPETRAESLIKEAAIVLLSFDIRENEGVVWVEFGILPTPNGKILKTLLDCGCQIGVSSRGIGDEVIRDGETIIDPDTFEFYAWDAVVTPAVKSARPSLSESLKKTTLKESLKTEIENTTCISDLDSIERVVESLNLPDIDSIKESINNKKSLLGDNILSKNENLESLVAENETLKKNVKKLESKLSANNIRIKDMKERLHEAIDNSRKMSKSLQEHKINGAKLERSIIDGVEQIEELTSKCSMFENLCRKYKFRTRSIKEAYETCRDNLVLESRKSKNCTVKYESEINDLTIKLERSESSRQKAMVENKELSRKLSKLNKLNCTLGQDLENKNKELSNVVSESKAKISKLNTELASIKQKRSLTENKARTESQELNTKLENVVRENKETIEKYLRVRCTQLGIGVDTAKGILPKTYTTEDIDKVVKELSDRKDRINKLPIAMRPIRARLSESLDKVSDEDKQTMAILNSQNI